MTATRNNAILPTIMGEMLCAFLLCFLCCTASPLPSNRSYHYGYDNGQRTPLMQLHDGLYLQSIIMQNVISDEIESFLPNPQALRNTALKNMTLSVIEAIKQITVLEEMESTLAIEAVIILLRRVMEDGCQYLQDAWNLPDDRFNCTLSELTDLQTKIQLAEYIMHSRSNAYQLLPTGTSLKHDFPCAYWNSHVRKNCTISTPAITQIQNTLLVSRVQIFTDECVLCPTDTR